MKRTLLSVCLIGAVLFSASAQKENKDSVALAKFEKALFDIGAKDFVIIVDSYKVSDTTEEEGGPEEGGSFETNTDNANFISYEKEFMFFQGQIVADNAYTNKLTVSDYSQVTDKKGNVRISMQVTGFYIRAKVEISLKKKAGNYADVIITPTKGSTKRFSGYVVPTAKSEYFKRSSVI
jgi:hypothetical protein